MNAVQKLSAILFRDARIMRVRAFRNARTEAIAFRRRAGRCDPEYRALYIAGARKAAATARDHLRAAERCAIRSAVLRKEGKA